MGHRMKWLLIVIGTAAGLYGLYLLGYPSNSYRFRITIEVEATEGLKTGSSVLEVTTIQYPAWVTLGANDHQTSVRGEAVFVDLGGGRNLVALLALGPNAEDGTVKLFAPRSFLNIGESVPRDVEWTKQLSEMTGRAIYAGEKRPTLVTFTDRNDPSTVRTVPFDNPQSVLGPGVRSVRAQIDLTSNPVTETLQSKLPWIENFGSAQVAWRIVRQGQYGSSAGPLQLFRRKGE